jgi:hypothetical protein
MHKPDLMIVLGKGKKHEDDGGEEGSPESSDDIDEHEYEELGDKVLEAMEAKDGLQVGLAIKALVEECMKGYEK